MRSAHESHTRYLLAELDTLASELRRPTGTLSRSQLADLAERARHDAAGIWPNDEGSRSDLPRRGRVGSAEIIPLFGPRRSRK